LVVDDPVALGVLPVLGAEVLDELLLGELLLGRVLELEPLLLLPLMLPDDDVPPAAPLAPEPDLLKWASHSAREMFPSLFVSRAEKLGAEELDEALADGALEEPLEALPDAAGVDVDGLLDEDEDWAPASDDSAKSTAAAVMLRVLGMDGVPIG
jgi:hypothetical protein